MSWVIGYSLSRLEFRELPNAAPLSGIFDVHPGNVRDLLGKSGRASPTAGRFACAFSRSLRGFELIPAK
jgi:hypothetical protein